MQRQMQFSDAYPAARNTDTSRAAAASVAPSAARVRSMVLNAIRASAGLTADEAAGRLGMSVLTVRPRVSELGKSGAIVDAGIRRPNQSGRRAIVWRARA